MSNLAAANAVANLQKLKQERHSIVERIEQAQARLEVIDVQITALEPLAVPVKTTKAKPSSPK